MKSAFDRNLVIRKDLFKFEHFTAKLFLDMEIYSEPKYISIKMCCWTFGSTLFKIPRTRQGNLRIETFV